MGNGSEIIHEVYVTGLLCWDYLVMFKFNECVDGREERSDRQKPCHRIKVGKQKRRSFQNWSGTACQMLAPRQCYLGEGACFCCGLQVNKK